MILAGDSLAVGMQPYLRPQIADIRVGRHTEDELRRLRRFDVRGKTILVSLGTNDLGHSAAWMAHEARRLLARGPRCVAWGEINVRGTTLDDRLNAGLRRTRVHLVRAVPTGPDGVHPRSYAALARRFRTAC